ncbi:MAG: peptidylprolyl isomerase [Lachnospiraceae bacterium]|nr:peptidylprolyl isomerase [Lachnospiraceae bacterium]
MANEYLAKIGDLLITNEDIDRVIASFPEEQRRYLTTAEGRERILNQKIANCVMALDAKESGEALSDEFKMMKADFEEQYLAQLEITDAFAEVVVSDEEAQKYYEDCKENFKTDEQVNARHILVDTLEQCQEIRNKILTGEISFEDAAKEHSTCSSAADGGELGFFGHGMMVAEFDEAAFAAALNEVTEPVKTQFGYHLIKVVEKKEPGYTPFEEVEAQIRQGLSQQKQNQALLDRIAALTEKYGPQDIDEAAIDRLIAMYPPQHQEFLATEEGRNGVRDQKTAYMVMTLASREKGKDKEESFFRAMNDYEEQMLAQQMIQKLFDSVAITDEEAKKYYDVTISAYRINEQVRAKHILVDTLESAQEIRNRILAGEISFEDAAKENSTCPSKEEGGDLGFFEHGQMVKEFDEAAFAAPVGEVTEPVKTNFGYHLIKVEAKKEAGEKPFEEVKAQIVQQMTEQRKNEVYFAKVQELKDRFGVEMA